MPHQEVCLFHVCSFNHISAIRFDQILHPESLERCPHASVCRSTDVLVVRRLMAVVSVTRCRSEVTMGSAVERTDEHVRDYLIYRGFTSALKHLDSDIKADKEKGFRVTNGDLLQRFCLTGSLQWQSCRWNISGRVSSCGPLSSGSRYFPGGAGGAAELNWDHVGEMQPDMKSLQASPEELLTLGACFRRHPKTQTRGLHAA